MCFEASRAAGEFLNSCLCSFNSINLIRKKTPPHRPCRVKILPHPNLPHKGPHAKPLNTLVAPKGKNDQLHRPLPRTFHRTCLGQVQKSSIRLVSEWGVFANVMSSAPCFRGPRMQDAAERSSSECAELRLLQGRDGGLKVHHEAAKGNEIHRQ